MILFYDKDGKIVGTVDGRVNSEDHLKMSMGEKGQYKRILVNWIPVGEHFIVLDREIEDGGAEVIGEDGQKYWEPKYKKVKQRIKITDFAPDHEQKDIFIELDKEPMKVYDYKVDVKTLKLIKK